MDLVEKEVFNYRLKQSKEEMLCFIDSLSPNEQLFWQAVHNCDYPTIISLTRDNKELFYSKIDNDNYKNILFWIMATADHHLLKIIPPEIVRELYIIPNSFNSLSTGKLLHHFTYNVENALSIINLLVSCGIDVNLKDGSGDNFFSFIFKNFSFSKNDPRRLKIIIDLANFCEYDFNQPLNTDCYLIMDLLSNHRNKAFIIAEIIKHGRGVNIFNKNNDGNNFLHIAFTRYVNQQKINTLLPAISFDNLKLLLLDKNNDNLHPHDCLLEFIEKNKEAMPPSHLKEFKEIYHHLYTAFEAALIDDNLSTIKATSPAIKL